MGFDGRSYILEKGQPKIIAGAVAARNLLRQRAYPAFCETLAVVGRPLLLSRAEDVTSRTAARSCLVLAPHPDDETLGCGATIMRKLVTGASVRVVIATDGRHSPRPNKLSIDAFVKVREEEARRAARFWGSRPRTLRFYALKMVDWPTIVDCCAIA